MQIEVIDDDEVQEAQQQYEFFELAKKYCKHYHEFRVAQDIKSTCLVCEAIKEIDLGQRTVSEMLDGQSRNGRYEKGYNPAKPF